MMTIQEAAKYVLKFFNKGAKITAGFPLKDYYIFEVMPQNAGSGRVLDSMYGVSKNGGKIFEYSPSFDLDEFREASKNVVKF